MLHQEYEGELSNVAQMPIFNHDQQPVCLIGYCLTTIPWLRRKAIAAKWGLKIRCDCEEEMHDSHMKD